MTSSSTLERTASVRAIYSTALQAVATGISVVPIRADGTKHPALSGWRAYQQHRASALELERWFASGNNGLAFITGYVSGNLEALDFDDQRIFAAWRTRMQEEPGLASLYEYLSCGYLESTPGGGAHLLYRCQTVEGNQKLACRPNGDRRDTLIETRGEGGLIIVAPSHGRVHPSGRPYTLLHGGVWSIRTITTQQRSLLFAVACAFDRMPPVRPTWPQSKMSPPLEHDEQRPGDLFNQQTSWEEVLVPHGWQLVRMRDEESYWRRPGKRGPGISATTNHSGHDLLYVFSTSTMFEVEKGYTKFSAYTLLNHHGDYSAAARALVELGYVPRKERA